MKCVISFLVMLITAPLCFSQNVSLYKQYNGRYDYSAIGNTMNLIENGPLNDCTILTSSSAELNLNPEDVIIGAYLYWAGSGTGDFEVRLNEVAITAERSFSDAIDETRVFFAAFADVTDLVIAEGNTTYTLSDLDLSDVIADYCPTGTNFAGWAIAIVYENEELPLNQLNIYDGLESVPDELSITLDNLNVLDNENAKIGFIAWEGDSSISVTEQLQINGVILSNPPLNPEDNAFNSTNSFTGANNLYNMDLDVYNIQNNISIGDTAANISLTSGQDFVMINTIITVLNSQLPDATISIDNALINCGLRDLRLDYTVYNRNSTEILPAEVPIAFYYDGQLIGQHKTTEALNIGDFEQGSINLTIPGNQLDIEIVAVVDDQGDGTGIVTEINEDNNAASETYELLEVPDTIVLDDLSGCNEGFEKHTFNLFDIVTESIAVNNDNLSFYENESEAFNAENPISDPSSYQNNSGPQAIYLRVESPPCFQLYTFELQITNCPPQVPEGFSPNGDSLNDFFNIKGLYNVFMNHELLIYNRNGSLIFSGDNNTKWTGQSNRGLGGSDNKVPVGTYYYVLNLKDPDYESISGWVYVNY
jgi:gliding motility-associated-like protein